VNERDQLSGLLGGGDSVQRSDRCPAQTIRHSGIRLPLHALVAVIAILGASGRPCWPRGELLLVDYFIVPRRTLTIADEHAISPILALPRGVVGFLAGRRRAAQIRAQGLARELRNRQLEARPPQPRPGGAAQAASAFARTEQQDPALCS